ncbi:putative apyrase [Lupinus albus]|uniref:Putative apyrase n=1 Tax=Lupinus albus TaxID=3870 RepID=A0A6A4P5V6_LUPAL|nr:putative apyrase [Lupinus albus]
MMCQPHEFLFFEGIYTYEGVEYKAYSPSAGSNLDKCRRIVVKVLNLNAACALKNCTFDGKWDGGRGSGQNNLILTSSFYFLATQVGFADINKPIAIVRPVDFKIAAKQACKIKFEDAKSTYPNLLEKELPYTCMDLIYQYTLLVDGFGLDPFQEVTVAKKFVYKDVVVDASWPLGSAIEAISSFT